VSTELEFKDGMGLLMQQGALIAMFPVEKWLEDLGRSETIAGIVDPTLYRDYPYSEKPEVIKDVLRAAIKFKAVILAAQEKVRANPKAFK
jgi:hypothetical protein